LNKLADYVGGLQSGLAV